MGEERGIAFIALEYLLGMPLDRFLKTRGDLPLAQALRVCRETVLGLAAAHERGLVHRDVKPGNVWLEAPKGRVKILDFGLARAQNDDAHLTGSGAVLGTPAYMSPEQGRGLPVDHRTDLFSLGVMLYRLTTGRMPFTGDTAMAVLTSLAVDTPVPPRRINPELPEALEAVVNKLLAKNPGERFQSAREVADALAEIENPRSGGGASPVAVRVQPLVVGAQAQNVWEGIEDSESVAVPLNPDDATEVEPVASQRTARHSVSGPPSKWPAVLAVAGLLVACAILAGVLLRPSKKEAPVPKPVAEAPAPTGIRPQLQPLPATDPDRTAADYVLSIGGTVKVNGEEQEIMAAAELPNRPFTLTGVNLELNTKVTDAGLAHFKGCKELITLDLGRTPVTDAGLAHFKDCKKLEMLWPSSAPVTDAGVAHFRGCQHLTDLSLGGTLVTDKGLANFKGCTRLTTLLLYATQVTDAGLVNFKECTGLKYLNLGDTVVTDTGLANFQNCKGLVSLNLYNTALTDAGLASFRGCNNLTTLNLSGTKVEDSGLTRFQDCKGLTFLSLERTAFTGAGLANFAGCENLAHLALYETAVTDAGLAHFKGCTRVTQLYLGSKEGSPIGDAGLANFKGCKGLETLFLNNTRVTDAGLAPFGDCTSLESLSLFGTQATDAGLAHFKSCKRLKTLHLGRTRVGDASLTILKGYQDLLDLDVHKTNVTPAAVPKLAKALPRCKIVHDGGTIEPKK